MSLKFLEVVERAQVKDLTEVAKEIWFEHYFGIISVEQVGYMVEKYQSVAAITRQIVDEGYQYYLLVCGEVIIGYFGIRDDAEKLFLSKLYLKKNFRGKGYFSEMLQYIESVAESKGHQYLYLTVNKHNDSTVAVYKKKGFSISKEVVTDIGNGFVMDDYVMEKKITLQITTEEI